MSTAKLCAIVPIRHDSRRVAGKNYRIFGDVPLYHHILSTLLNCPSIDQIVVDTDSPVVKSGCKKNFKRVKVIDRPEHLRDEHTSMNDVLKHTIEQMPADLYLQTHTTNPLLSSETIETAIATLHVAGDKYDSLFGVTRLQQRLWTGDGQPVNHDPNQLIRTQDLDPLFIDNSCIYLFKRDTLIETGNRIGKSPRPFEIDRVEAIDIDEESDWQMAESIYRMMNPKPDIKPVARKKAKAA